MNARRQQLPKKRCDMIFQTKRFFLRFTLKFLMTLAYSINLFSIKYRGYLKIFFWSLWQDFPHHSIECFDSQSCNYFSIADLINFSAYRQRIQFWTKSCSTACLKNLTPDLLETGKNAYHLKLLFNWKVEQKTVLKRCYKIN